MHATLRIGLALAISALVSPLAWAANPAITFFEERPAGAKAIMVMDAEGANRTEIFRTVKKYGGSWLRPTISTDGLWVAIEHLMWAAGVLAIPTTGGEPQWLVCDCEGMGCAHILFNRALEYSPASNELAVLSTYFPTPPGPPPTDFVMILPENGIGICPYLFDDLDVLATVDPARFPYSGVTWSHDGTRIAYWEADPVLERDWVVILDRATGAQTARMPVAWPAGSSPWDLDFEPEGLSWQRSGELVFATDAIGHVWLLEYDAASGSLAARQLTEGSEPVWSPDDAQLLYGIDGQLARLTLATGSVESLGAGYRPDWKRDPFAPSTCTSDPDCDDGNECTSDLCADGECSHLPVDDGAPCGTAGWCASGICFEPECGAPELPGCDDGNECTVDTCVGFECLFDPAAASGLPCDDGDPCTTDDACDGVVGLCFGVFDPTIPGCGCGPKGAPCSSGDECCSGQCHPVKGTCK